MPVMLIGLVFMALSVCCIFIYLIKIRKSISFKKKGGDILIFTLSLASLIISLVSFWNTADYIDEFGGNTYALYGGSFWLYMAWLELGFLFVVSIISGLKLIKRSE